MSFKNYIQKYRKRLRKRKSLIVFLSIISILGLTTATYAWFTVNTFAGIQDFELKISTGEDLRVSMDNHGSDIDLYTHVITNDMINSYLRKNYNKTIEDIVLDPVTSNNGKTFAYQNGTAAEPNDTDSYFEFECYFIATKDMHVHLTTEEGVDENNNKIEGTDVSSDSPAPKNDVVRANRISFAADGDSGNAKTYEPNKGSQVTSLSTFDLPSGTMTYNDSNNLFSLEKLTPKKVTVRLWLEGEDPECVNRIQGADLKVRLAFVGIKNGSNTPG
ncbi:MAG: hypothetical protein K6F88_04585 [Ruminococcus sp.]|nr:hypothetical protein [Ruminococcus sp.]